LIASNTFMTIAWYGNLLYPNMPLRQAVLFGWGVAFFEYVLAVPANRMGYFQYPFTPAQLKIIQEVITLTVFAIFAQPVRWNYFVSFGFLIAAVVAIFL
jgi:uncharacterized protein (DUF486 family)